MTTPYRFTLYVSGGGPGSTVALRNLHRLCQERLATGEYDIAVVDVLQAVDEADTARILVTPTVVRLDPPPVVRVLGELAVTQEVAEALGLPDPRRQ